MLCPFYSDESKFISILQSNVKLPQVTLRLTPEDSAKIKLHCTVTFAGEDVIEGEQDMVETGIITYPPPEWVWVPLWVKLVVLFDISRFETWRPPELELLS